MKKDTWYSVRALKGFAKIQQTNPNFKYFATAKLTSKGTLIILAGAQTHILYNKTLESIQEDELFEAVQEENDLIYTKAFDERVEKIIKQEQEELEKIKQQEVEKEAYSKMTEEDQVKHDMLKNFQNDLAPLKGTKKDIIIKLHELGYERRFIKAHYPTDNNYFEQVCVEYDQWKNIKK